jgi:hypothetical protein
MASSSPSEHEIQQRIRLGAAAVPRISTWRIWASPDFKDKSIGVTP